MNIKETGMNAKFIYNSDNTKIEGIEFDVNMVIKLDLPSDSAVKWDYVQFLNETYEQAKHRINSVSFN